MLNINGKQHHAVTGDMFEVAPDPQTKCSIKVQSFDMFQTQRQRALRKAK